MFTYSFVYQSENNAYKTISNNLAENDSFLFKNLKISPNCDKWIVLRTLNEPTENNKYLRDSAYAWCFLVVADKQTPIKWKYKDIYYLSLTEQDELIKKFKIIKKIPYNSYHRKIIGYLFAISKNAKYIYELDDDQSPSDGLIGFRYEYFNGLKSNSKEINPINYFKANKKNFPHSFKVTNKYPIIQHSLENIDKLDNNLPPLLLDSNQYAVYNSKNTFYHYDSFWSLIFPLTFDDSKRDVIRSIITIRLLNEIDATLAFFPSNSNKINKNYIIEDHNYLNIKTILEKWECEYNQFSKCFIECINHLKDFSVFNEKEISFYESWIEDLNSLNYKWPKFKIIETEINEPNIQIEASYLLKAINITAICNIKLDNFKPCSFNDTILITNASNLEDLKEITSTAFIHFTNVIICTKLNIPILNPGLTVISTNKSFNECVQLGLDMGFRQQSFIIAKKFSQLEYWNFNKISLEIISLNDTTFEKLTLVRKNVANGLRAIKFVSTPTSFCDVYKQNNENKICQYLFDSISKLNWHSNDLASEYCTNLKRKTIWIPDFHDGPRVDLSSTLIHLGQNPILAGSKLARSPYPESLALSKISHTVSDMVKKFSVEMTDILTKKNYLTYKDNNDFKQVDAVICSFPSSLCEGFMPLNQTLIFNPAHRYNLARSTKQKWIKLNENYKLLKSKSKIILSAMSKYDAEYQFHFTGFKSYRLYAYGGYYTKGVKYNPIREEILIGPANHIGPFGHKMLNELKSFSNSSGLKFEYLRKIYPRYRLDQLANHKAILLFPYAVMSYSIIDFYISKIPIFIPSIKMLTENKNVHDRAIKFYFPNIQLNEPYYKTNHLYNPNLDDDLDYEYWLQFADYYQWPFVTVFDSWKDLIIKLKTLDLKEISRKMEEFNYVREADLLTNWCQILKQINKSPIPKSFEEFLVHFNISTLMI